MENEGEITTMFSALAENVADAAGNLVSLISEVAVPILGVAVAIAGLTLAIRLIRKAG